ncbi:MAG: DNA polymerase, partial [Candidatus Limnocylindrales bacterium]
LDMLQLVSERTSLMTTRGGVQQTVIYDPAAIVERYGLTAAQMIDFKALKGDTTDNIPGIPGVGDKTAAKLLIDFGSLDAIYADVERVLPEKLRQKVVEHHDQVLTNRELVTIHRDLPVELDLSTAGLGDYDRAEVMRLFREYEFRSLVERLPGVDGEAPLAPGEALRRADGSSPMPAAIVPGRELARPRSALPGEGSGLQLTLAFDALGAPAEVHPPERPATAATSVTAAVAPPSEPAARLRALIGDPGLAERLGPGEDPTAWLAGQASLAVGLALDDPRPRRGTLLGMAVAGADGRLLTAPASEAPRLLASIAAAGRPIAGHETKRLLVSELARRDPSGASERADFGAVLPPVSFDTQIAAYILNAALRSQTLVDISAERLGIELPAPGTLGGADHAALEAAAVAAVRPGLEASLEEVDLARLYGELELPLIPVLAAMEATGVAIDRAALAGLGAEFATEIARLEAAIYDAVGHEFNLGSPKQLEQILFHELDLPKGRRTKTGYSTDATVLEELRPAHPMIPMLLDWRIYTKLKSTYVDALPLLIDPATGRLHTTFHQAVASTGRLSSSDPNLQNIPIRTDLGRRIRRAFVAGSPETTLLAADYSQIELRILAHVSGDAALKDAFAHKLDIHRATAALVLHKAPADVTPDERSMAKMVNFGIAYGMSDFGLSSRANISRAEAQAFINGYFSTYSGISYYMLHIKDVARTQGYVTTLLGRRRWIPELAQRNPNLRAAGERMAINMPIQGTAADIVKIAMIRLD